MKAYTTYIKSLQSSPVSGPYFFLGDEDFLKDEAEMVLFERVTSENAGTPPDKIHFHCSAVSPDTVEEACSCSSLFGGYRFVIVSEFEQWSPTEQKAFLSWLDESGAAPGTVLVIKGTIRKLPANVTGCSVHVFWKFYESQLIKWITSRLKEQDIAMDSETARYMVELYSGDDVRSLRLVAAEIDKLILYLGKGGTVTKDVIRTVCSAPPQSEFYRFLNALFQRKHRQSMRYARELFHENASSVTGYMSVLSSSFADMVQMKAIALSCPDLWKDLLLQAKRRQAKFLKRDDRAVIDKAINAIKKEIVESAAPELGSVFSKSSVFAIARKVIDVEGFTADELVQALHLATCAEQNLKCGKGTPLVELDILVSRICVGGLL